jgi:methyltransferase
VVVFLAGWLLLALSRLEELVRARRNTQRLVQRGAREYAPKHYFVMVLIHVAWFALSLLEVAHYGCLWNLKWLALGLIGQGLRYWTQAYLGERWTTRILVMPGELAQRGGPFGWLRHPNYVGVVLEMWSYPMAVGAWRTALGLSMANGLLLKWRISQEERAWKLSGNW